MAARQGLLHNSDNFAEAPLAAQMSESGVLVLLLDMYALQGEAEQPTVGKQILLVSLAKSTTDLVDRQLHGRTHNCVHDDTVLRCAQPFYTNQPTASLS